MGVPFISSHARRRDQVVAVDLGVRSTKAVQVQRRGDAFSLVNYVLLDSPVFDKNSTADLRNPMVVLPNIGASNGIAHAIDRVLLPINV